MNALTLTAAKELIGKKIATHYNGYAGQDGDDIFTVGEIITAYEIGKRRPYPPYKDEPFKNFAEYWESYMTADQLKRLHNQLEIITIDGRETYIRCDINSTFFSVPTFHCSDSDRTVTYQLKS